MVESLTYSLRMLASYFCLCQIVLEADGYQPYLISPEKGLRSLIKGVLELAKEPSRLCVDEVCFELVIDCIHKSTRILCVQRGTKRTV